jgi:hypothetical protein
MNPGPLYLGMAMDFTHRHFIDPISDLTVKISYLIWSTGPICCHFFFCFSVNNKKGAERAQEKERTTIERNKY